MWHHHPSHWTMLVWKPMVTGDPPFIQLIRRNSSKRVEVLGLSMVIQPIATPKKIGHRKRYSLIVEFYFLSMILGFSFFGMYSCLLSHPRVTGLLSTQAVLCIHQSISAWQGSHLKERRWEARGPYGCVWKWLVPLNAMVLLIIIPCLNGYFIGNIPYFQTNLYVVL